MLHLSPNRYSPLSSEFERTEIWHLSPGICHLSPDKDRYRAVELPSRPWKIAYFLVGIELSDISREVAWLTCSKLKTRC